MGRESTIITCANFLSFLQTKFGTGKGGKVAMVKVKSHDETSAGTEGKTKTIILIIERLFV